MDNCGVDMDVWVRAHILIQRWLVWDIFNMGDAPETGILWCSFGEVAQVYKVIMLPFLNFWRIRWKENENIYSFILMFSFLVLLVF